MASQSTNNELTEKNVKVKLDNDEHFHFSPLTLETIRKIHEDFVIERDWNQFHSPRNVFMALVGEVGEIAEHFQWKPDSQCQVGLPGWTLKQRQDLGEELSDVLIYLVRLADRCEIDLSQAVIRKMEKNSVKYPVEKAKGNANKYTEL